jgi:guanine deaminase
MSPQRKLLLLGTFVHSRTQQDLEFLHNAGIAVDAEGKIAAVERDAAAADVSETKARLLKRLGWNEAEVDVTVAAEGQFFFPGFVGEFCLQTRSQDVNPYLGIVSHGKGKRTASN